MYEEKVYKSAKWGAHFVGHSRNINRRLQLIQPQGTLEHGVGNNGLLVVSGWAAILCPHLLHIGETWVRGKRR